MNPMQQTSNWLSAHAGFPARRLPAKAELLLCVAALAGAEDSAATGRKLIQRRMGAQDAALRAHAMRRSRVHYKCDNSAKV
ncbi:MAG: hypothetical protein KA257_12920 [Opitutaceae bacterium]|nr:hypothetical protein [Opitutaceae bacterium]MBP9914318.1 hypothetical protein [Opitutaceae bacterium]